MERYRTYIDTNVVSAYVTNMPDNTTAAVQWSAVHALWETAKRRGIRFVSSRFILEESAQGRAGPSRRRLNALRAVTLFEETEHIRKQAREMLDVLGNAQEEKRLAADARHYAAALSCKAQFLVTWDEKDFYRLETLAVTLGLENLPEIVHPIDATFALGSAVLPNPVPMTLLDKLKVQTPWVRGILRDTEQRQARAMKRCPLNRPLP